MKLQNTLLENFDHFEINLAAITLHTLDKDKITLPYTDLLPAQFEGAANAHISMNVRPGDVRVVLFADKDGKKLHAGIEATPDEINSVLEPLFFKTDGNGYQTRFDNGFDKYWLGRYQAEYMMWKRITLEGGANGVALSLPDDKRAELLTFLQRMKCQMSESAGE